VDVAAGLAVEEEADEAVGAELKKSKSKVPDVMAVVVAVGPDGLASNTSAKLVSDACAGWCEDDEDEDEDEGSSFFLVFFFRLRLQCQQTHPNRHRR